METAKTIWISSFGSESVSSVPRLFFGSRGFNFLPLSINVSSSVPVKHFYYECVGITLILPTIALPFGLGACFE